MVCAFMNNVKDEDHIEWLFIRLRKELAVVAVLQFSFGFTVIV